MVGLKLSRKQAKPIAAPESDYGSDFDEETVNELLSQAEHPGQPRALLDKDFEQDPVLQDAPPTLQRTVLHDRPAEQGKSNPTTPPPNDLRRGPQIEIEYDEVNRSAFSRTFTEIPLSLP